MTVSSKWSSQLVIVVGATPTPSLGFGRTNAYTFCNALKITLAPFHNGIFFAIFFPFI
jgi:hypothetical protein